MSAIDTLIAQISDPRLQRQQLGQVVFEHQTEFLFFLRVVPLGSEALAQAGIADLGDQGINGGQTSLLLAYQPSRAADSCSFSNSLRVVATWIEDHKAGSFNPKDWKAELRI